MAKLKKPFDIPGTFWTLRGVDDWLAYLTDELGTWYCYWTECSPVWPQIPRSIPMESADMVIATAILAAQQGVPFDRVEPEYEDEIEALFGEAA